jgi:hypothetical protein
LAIPAMSAGDKPFLTLDNLEWRQEGQSEVTFAAVERIVKSLLVKFPSSWR